jgi:hypothetical protein
VTPTNPAKRERQTGRDLEFRVVRKPMADARQHRDAAVDVLADAIADHLIAESRAEVAQEHGVSEEAIDREHTRVAEAARALLPAGVRAGHPADEVG